MGTPSGSEPVHDIRISRDVKIAMRDGVRLSANLFLPRAAGRFPLIFQRMPYGFSGADLGAYYARRGYAYMVQDCRGRYDSEGEFYPFEADGRDGYDTLDWVVAQPWSDGRVGMFGPSYLGGVQWLLACENHPALRAIVPNVIPADLWREAYWHDGAFSLALNALWTCLEISSRTSDLDMIPAYDLQAFFRHLPLATLDEAAGGKSRFWRDFLAHSQYSEVLGEHGRAHPVDNLDAVLAIQEQNLGRESERLSRALALVRAARTKLASGTALSIDDLATLTKETVMQELTEQERMELLKPISAKYFTQEDAAALKQRKYDQPAITAQWNDLFAQAKTLAAANADPASPPALELARRWRSLIEQFTGGDEAMEGKIRAVWKDAMADPKLAPLIPLTPEVSAFMAKAREHLTKEHLKMAHLKGAK